MSTELNGIPDIAMAGLGYIRLPTATLMASRGLEAIGEGVNQSTVDTINAGNVHIVEPDLESVVRSTVTTDSLCATTVMKNIYTYLAAVPTPLEVVKAITRKLANLKTQQSHVLVLHLRQTLAAS